MKSSIYNRRLGWAYYGGNIVEISLTYTLEAFEMRQKSFACLLADPFDRVKSRYRLRAAAAVAVMSDSKPVGLVGEWWQPTLPSADQTGIAARQHLFHRREIIRSLDGLDIEVAVVFF